MDIRKTGYHALITATGLSEPLRLNGSIMSIVSELLKQLTLANPRSSEPEIVLRIKTRPINDFDIVEDKRIAELEAGLIGGERELPLEGETLTQMIDRLQESKGFPYASACVIAYAEFGQEWSGRSAMDSWMNDPQAMKFRKIHASNTSFHAADPLEAAALESYCREHFPEYIEHMTLRS